MTKEETQEVVLVAGAMAAGFGVLIFSMVTTPQGWEWLTAAGFLTIVFGPAVLVLIYNKAIRS